MSYFTTKIKLIANKLDYGQLDINKISGAKYRWLPENNGKPNSVQGECCFEYPDTDAQVVTSNDLKTITEQEYTDFGKVTITSDKTQIKADGIDSPAVRVAFPEGGGTAMFKILTPTKEKINFDIPIPENGIVNIPTDKLTTTEKGVTTISYISDKWGSASGFKTLQIEST